MDDILTQPATDVARMLRGRELSSCELTEAQLRECAAILDEALERIRQVLKQSPDTEERS